MHEIESIMIEGSKPNVALQAAENGNERREIDHG